MQLRVAGIAVVLAATLAAIAAGPAYALDPHRSLVQYKHSGWTVDDGAPVDIRALAQTRDGYLWIGGATGLFRFDGVKFEAMPVLGGPTDDRSVTALMTSRSGDLWIGYGSGKIGVMHGTRQIDASPPAGRRQTIRFVEDRAGIIWSHSVSFQSPLSRWQRGRWELIDESWGLPGGRIAAVLARHDGSLWVTTDKGTAALRPGVRRFQLLDTVNGLGRGLIEDENKQIWVLDPKAGTGPVTGGRGKSSSTFFVVGLPSGQRDGIIDRDGNIWGTTGSAGILRVATAPSDARVSDRSQDRREEIFRASDGLTSDNTKAIIEDREGNIWVGTSVGLDRFRAADVVAETAIPQHSPYGYVIMASRSGIMYAVDSESLYRVEPNKRPVLVLGGLKNPESLCESANGTIWLGTHGGIYRGDGYKFDRLTDAPEKSDSLDCLEDKRGAIWFALVGSGMLRYQSGIWAQVPLPAGRDEAVTAMVSDVNGGFLVSLMSRGLIHADPPRSQVIWPYRAMPGGNITALYQGTDSILIGSQNGLAELRDARLRVLKHPTAELRGITGLVQTPAGDTWVLSAAGIVRMTTPSLERALSNPFKQPLKFDIFNHLDGLDGPPTFAYVKNSAVRGGDGRLWFITTEGLVKIDPAHLIRNPLAPNVKINGIVADGQRFRDPHAVTLAKGTSDVQIDYTALSLTMPERVRFFYRLDGVDKKWIDPGLRRQAFYTNLKPGEYSFQVIASNNDGVWNRKGAVLHFNIPPTFLQSTTFMLLCSIAAVGMLWWIYLLRIRQLTARLQEQQRQRLAERERIARDLHDTLLQGFQGLILRFQSAANAVPAAQPARALLEQALQRADMVMIEGRDSVRQLRARSEASLAEIFQATAESARGDNPTDIQVAIEGEPRELATHIRDELAAIGDEAIINALRHAAARRIDVLLTFTASEVQLIVRDDGTGIPQEVVRQGGRTGHFGLIGMRERAEHIGGSFSVASRAGGGTEVLAVVPTPSNHIRQQLGIFGDRLWSRLPRGI